MRNMYQNKLTTSSMFSYNFLNLTFFMKFHASRVINSYSANKIAKWVHAKTKIAQM